MSNALRSSSSSSGFPLIFGLIAVQAVQALGGCQIIGGLADLRLGAATGGAGGAGGAGGESNASSSSGSNGVGGSGGGTAIAAIWSKRFGDGTSQLVTDVAVDTAENIFVVGAFLGTLDFGTSKPLVSAGDYDAYVAKLDADGNPLWAMQLGGPGPDRIESVALTNAGDVVVGGSYGGTFNLGMTNFPYAGGMDGFVANFSGTDGSLVWRRTFGDAQNQRCASVAVAGMMDDVFCFGDFSGQMTVGMQTLTSAGLEDLFAVRYTSAGVFFAVTQSGDPAGQTARSIVVNDSLIAYLAARFDGKLAWGSVTSAGQGDVFLGRFLGNGGVDWALSAGDTNTQQPNGISLVGQTGGVAFVGDYKGAATFGGNALVSKGGFDAFVGRADSTGTVLWVRSLGDGDDMVMVDDQYASDVAAMNDGTLFVTGYAAGAVDFGSGLVTGPGDTDFYLVRFDPTGKTQWGLRSGGTNSQYGRAIALSGTNEIVVAGEFRETLDLGNGPLTSAGSNDVFIAKFSR